MKPVMPRASEGARVPVPTPTAGLDAENARLQERIDWLFDTLLIEHFGWRQCQAAGVAVFYKQGGYHNRCPHDRKGGHFECFPDDLKVREFPNAIR